MSVIKRKTDMIKIFIDTNIVLDMYRKNLANDISILMNFIFANKKLFITTEQSINEFKRNRRSRLEEAYESFQKTSEISPHNSSLLRSFPSYDKYSAELKKYNEHREKLLSDIREIINNKNKDFIYSKFAKLCRPECVIKTIDATVDRALKRKAVGNPPTSDKYTVGDEVIWESLLEYGKEHKNDLTIVTNDKTFFRNFEFLSDEYASVAGGKLNVVESIVQAYKDAGVDTDMNTIYAEENLTWTNVIVTALSNLGGQAPLSDIYKEATDILYYGDCDNKLKNNAKEATIRGILQRFSSDSPGAYNGKKDLFKLVGDGIWALR